MHEEYFSSSLAPLKPDPISRRLFSLDLSTLVNSGLSSMFWMTPVLAGLVGAGIYLIKFRTNRGY